MASDHVRAVVIGEVHRSLAVGQVSLPDAIGAVLVASVALAVLLVTSGLLRAAAGNVRRRAGGWVEDWRLRHRMTFRRWVRFEWHRAATNRARLRKRQIKFDTRRALGAAATEGVRHG